MRDRKADSAGEDEENIDVQEEEESTQPAMFAPDTQPARSPDTQPAKIVAPVDFVSKYLLPFIVLGMSYFFCIW